MSNTKYKRIDIKERTPEDEGYYYTSHGGFDWNIKEQYFQNDEGENLDYINYWLEEVPDRESELIEMLERVTSAFYGEELELYQFNRIEEAKKLIESVKQPK